MRNSDCRNREAGALTKGLVVLRTVSCGVSEGKVKAPRRALPRSQVQLAPRCHVVSLLVSLEIHGGQ